MTLEDFIAQNTEGIDGVINSVLYRYDGNGGRGTIPTPAPEYDNDEREQWIANDEALYLWARSEGVDV